MSSITAYVSAPRASHVVGWGRYALVALATVAAATAANVLVYFVGGALVAYDPEFLILKTVGATITVTLAAGIIAVLLYAALLRFTRNPAGIFTIVAAVVFVASLVPDFTYIPGVAGASGAQTATLVLMHVVAAAIIVPLLTTYAPALERSSGLR